jgi:hypothetical protein
MAPTHLLIRNVLFKPKDTASSRSSMRNSKWTRSHLKSFVLINLTKDLIILLKRWSTIIKWSKTLWLSLKTFCYHNLSQTPYLPFNSTKSKRELMMNRKLFKLIIYLNQMTTFILKWCSLILKEKCTVSLSLWPTVAYKKILARKCCFTHTWWNT